MKFLMTTLAIFLSLNAFSFTNLETVERSPFTDVVFKKAPVGAPSGLPTISVIFEGEDYFLLGVGSLDIKDIVSSCMLTFAEKCQDKFALNFLEVMNAAGETISDSVSLKLYKFSQHRVVTIASASVLEENVEEIIFNRELRGE